PYSIFKLIPALFIVNIMVACNNNESINNNSSPASKPAPASRLPEPDILQRLTTQKDLIDTMLYNAVCTSESFGLTTEGKVIKIADEQEESDMFSTIYLVVKNKLGAIVRISESPYSQSGDWSVSVIYYFDKNNRTFALEKNYATFHSLCNDEAVAEQRTIFYDKNMNTINNVRIVTGDGNRVVADSCIVPFYDDYAVLPDAGAFLKHFGIDTIGRKL
ncbi:MAG: hypothetical protein J7527_12355, partial [Chitinophagaceae bacterium]|nr:hypothetical protein [Chitinophagaceae bacterium]